MSKFDAVQADSIEKDQKTVNRHWLTMPLLSAAVTAGADILCHKAALVGDLPTFAAVGIGFAVGGLMTWRAARAHKRLMVAQNPQRMELTEALKNMGHKTQSLEETTLKAFTYNNIALAAISSLVGYWAPEAWSEIPFLFSNSKAFGKSLVGGFSGLTLLLTHMASYLSHKDVGYIASRSYEPSSQGKENHSVASQGTSTISPPAP